MESWIKEIEFEESPRRGWRAGEREKTEVGLLDRIKEGKVAGARLMGRRKESF